MGTTTVVAIAAAVFLWGPDHVVVAVRRDRRRKVLPAVVATDPPVDGEPVVPTATLDLVTTTEHGVDARQARLSPPVPGDWQWCAADELCFKPAAPYPMGGTETLSLPLSPDADEGGRSGRNQTFTMTFRVARESVGLAQVLLADLDYLPLRPTTAPQPVPAVRAPAVSSRGSNADGTSEQTGGPGADALPASGAAPPTTGDGADIADALGWRWPSVPSSLQALWSPGKMTVVTTGAIVQFERVEGITSGSYPPYSETMTPASWRALFAAALAGRRDPDDYAYAMVSEQQPERLELWSDGRDAVTTLVNTGIAGGATPTGTWAVYLRYPEQTMRGTTVSGAPYVYPDVKDVSYFEGNFAVHAFPRASYGYPQSQGCVEVPPDVAPDIYALLHYGSLVTVSP